MISGVPTCFPQSNPKLPTDQKIYIVKTGNRDTEMILEKRAEQKADTKTHENQGLRPVLSNFVSVDHTQEAGGHALTQSGNLVECGVHHDSEQEKLLRQESEE